MNFENLHLQFAIILALSAAILGCKTVQNGSEIRAITPTPGSYEELAGEASPEVQKKLDDEFKVMMAEYIVARVTMTPLNAYILKQVLSGETGTEVTDRLRCVHRPSANTQIVRTLEQKRLSSFYITIKSESQKKTIAVVDESGKHFGSGYADSMQPVEEVPYRKEVSFLLGGTNYAVSSDLKTVFIRRENHKGPDTELICKSVK